MDAVLIPNQFMQGQAAVKAFHLEGAAGDEGVIFAATNTVDSGGDENLPGLGLVNNARRQLNGGAEQVVVLGDRLPRIQADFQSQRQVRVVGVVLERSHLHVGCRVDAV